MSNTGLFADLTTLTPAAGVESYEVNLPFWSDHAVKRRWFAISNLTDSFGWRRDEPWETPVGAVWVKHFDIDLDRHNTNSRRRIETRLLVRTTNGAYGVRYKWNSAGTEAYLTPEMGDVIDLPVTNNGVPATQRWLIRSRSQCLACHRPSAGFVLGFDTRQLNRHGSIGGVSGNQLALLDAGGWFTNALDYSQPLPRYLKSNETNYSMEARARSDLAVNCGYCHHGSNSVPGSIWDGRAHILLEHAGVVRVPPMNNAGNTNCLLLAPGQPELSVIHRRMSAANDFSRMPPISTTVVDEEGVELIAEWIRQLPAWRSYAEWRMTRFGSTNSIAGVPDADPDEDGASNWAEYLAYTDPLDGASWWTGRIRSDPFGIVVEADLYSRPVWVETSSDLVSWTRWAVPGNDGIPWASGRIMRVFASPGPTNAFYRFRIGPP